MYLAAITCTIVSWYKWEKQFMDYWKPVRYWSIKLLTGNCSTDFRQLITVLGLYTGNPFDTIINC